MLLLTFLLESQSNDSRKELQNIHKETKNDHNKTKNYPKKMCNVFKEIQKATRRRKTYSCSFHKCAPSLQKCAQSGFPFKNSKPAPEWCTQYVGVVYY